MKNVTPNSVESLVFVLPTHNDTIDIGAPVRTHIANSARAVSPMLHPTKCLCDDCVQIIGRTPCFRDGTPLP
jgi:hypothetical protein